MLMSKPTGRIRCLAARSIPSAIAPGRSMSPLLLSATFSAQSELNDVFGFFRLAVAGEKPTRPRLFFRRHLNQSCGMHCVSVRKPCDLFRDILTYMLPQNGRTCQQLKQLTCSKLQRQITLR